MSMDYLGGFHYQGIALKFFPTAEGYVQKTGTQYSYVYNYTDHLGNIRLSYARNPQNPNVLKLLEENHYYPFGLKHTNYNSDLLAFQQKDPGPGLMLKAAPANPVPQYNYDYKYNGKEFQDEMGMNLYDYGARNYDPALGRFTNMDPHSENYYASSPYVYVYNNPNIFVDPNGKDGIVSGSVSKDAPYVLKANYYYSGLNKDQIAGVNSAIEDYNNGGNAFSFKSGKGEIFVKFDLTATEVADADEAEDRANGDNVKVGDKTIRFGNVINAGTVTGENHLGEAGKKKSHLTQKKTESLQKRAPGKSLEAIYKGTMIHEIGHNLGANHKDPGSIMNYTYTQEKKVANCVGDCGEGVFTYSMSSVNSHGIRAIMGRMGQTTEVMGKDGPYISTYNIIHSTYLGPKENAKITEGSVGRLTLIQNQ